LGGVGRYMPIAAFVALIGVVVARGGLAAAQSAA
jgi:hypothetical protein